MNIAVLISGGGTNLQALIDAQKDGRIKSGAIKLVIADRPGAYGLVRAKENGIKTLTIDKKSFVEKGAFDRQIIRALKDDDIHLVILAGFLSILGKELVKEYEGRIINVHPSLIPAFCGEGYYGLKVHQAALEKGVKVTGATVHYVNEIADDGEIIMQQPVFVKEGDTPESLQKRVMEEAEWVILPMAAEEVSRKLISDRKVEKNESL